MGVDNHLCTVHIECIALLEPKTTTQAGLTLASQMNTIDSMLTVGMQALDFSLCDGQKLSDLWAKGHVIVYFFPKAFTPG